VRQVNEGSRAIVAVEETARYIYMSRSRILFLNIASNSDNLCESCGSTSPKVYEQGWTCLHPNCSAFWLNFNEQSILTYTEEFLALVPQEPMPEGFVLVHPQDVPTVDKETMTTYTRGWHCKKCGRLSSR
jgi:ribosomal protein L37AE/L43A